ncbi:MAG: ATP-binding protein [Candidatus Bathyarchaeia archaeon]|jgi:DNA helicase HerA-like ATPase
MSERKIGRVVSTEKSPSFVDVDVRLDPGNTIRPGQLMFVDIGKDEPHHRFAILRVSTAMEVNPYENPLSSQVRDTFNIESSRNREDLLRKYTVVSSEVIEIVNIGNEGQFVFEEPSVIIPAGAEVFETLTEMNSAVLGFPEENTPTAISIGAAIGNENIKVTLDANKALPRHMLIVGSTGTGKSYLLGKLTEELHRIGIRHVNIDVHGELCDATKQLNGKILIPGENLTVRLSSLEEPEVLGMIPIQNQLHIDIVSRAFLNLKKTGRQFDVDAFEEEATNTAEQFGSGKSTHAIISARIQTLSNVSFLGSGFDWIKALKEKSALINVDCRNLGHWELRTVVGAIARELMYLRKRGDIEPLVISMDEAHLFLPSSENVTSSQVLSELIRMGRHYGVGIIIASQSPGDIDRRITKITNTRFVFAIEPSELASVSGLLGDTPRDLMDNLPRLRVGSCLLAGSRETVKHSLVVQVGNRSTKDGGTTPPMLKV